jgi:hypothetical protein
MLHKVLDLAEFAPTLVTLVFFKHELDPLPITVIAVVLLIPTLPTEIAFYMPSRLGVIIKHPYLAVAYCAKIHFFSIMYVLFLIA